MLASEFNGWVAYFRIIHDAQEAEMKKAQQGSDAKKPKPRARRK